MIENYEYKGDKDMYFDTYNLLGPLRRQQAEINNFIEDLTNQRKQALSVTQSIPTTTDVSISFNKFKEDRKALLNQIKTATTLKIKPNDFTRINYEFKLPKVEVPSLKLDPKVFDFRKNVEMHNFKKELSGYLDASISLSDALSIERKAISKNNDNEVDIKYKPTKLDNEKIDVSQLVMRINFLLSFIGVDLDYETLHSILEYIVEQVKNIIDNS